MGALVRRAPILFSGLMPILQEREITDQKFQNSSISSPLKSHAVL